MVKVREEDKPKLHFHVIKGYRRMPFGLTNKPAMFQHLIIDSSYTLSETPIVLCCAICAFRFHKTYLVHVTHERVDVFSSSEIGIINYIAPNINTSVSVRRFNLMNNRC